MNICAAGDQGPSSGGMARHLAPFSWRQRMAEMVRRRSFGCVLPLGRHASTNGSKFVHCASDTIALSSFQKEQNARHHKQFKREQALARRHAGTSSMNSKETCCLARRTATRTWELSVEIRARKVQV